MADRETLFTPAERFLIRTAGGPFPGTRVATSDVMSWPLPDELPDPEGRGVYVKGSESQLPPQGPDSHVMRGAEYIWKSADGDVTLCGAYDSRPETQAHIDRVRHFVGLATANLNGRAERHDASKLVSPEVEAFDIATPKLANLVYGSEEYKQSLRDLGPALQHHFANNDHHPEHFENGVRGMSLMALIEMLCDWRAASERMKQRTDDPEKVKTFESGLAYQKKRFGISDDLYEILLNTARELGL